MATYGITATGFVKPSIADLIVDFQTAYSAIKANPNFAPDSKISLQIGVMAKMLADSWDALEGIYNAPFPATADDASIPNVMDLVGLQMLPESKSQATCQCTGDPDTVIEIGTQIANANTGDLFAATEKITLPPSGVKDCLFQAIVAGPANVEAGTLTTIINHITGWSGVTNAQEGTVGRISETVTEAKIRRAQSLQVIGASAIDAIVSRVLNEVPNVTSCMGFTNRTMSVDSDGRPPKSNEILVVGGVKEDIGKKLWECTAGGIELYGTQSASVIDSQGNTQVVYYTIPVSIEVMVEITITKYNSKRLPTNYAELIKNAVAAYGNAFPIGQDLITSRWVVPCYGIDGVDEVTIQHKKASGGFTTSDIVMAYNEKTSIDPSTDVFVLGGPV
jgi:uncharacterized phage protein gp47/JayE